MRQIRHQLGDGRPPSSRAAAREGLRFLLRAAIDDPPDPAALAVAAGVGERHLVMADDAVVEVGDVEGTVGPSLMSTGRNQGSSLRRSRAARLPSGVEPCHSSRSWLIRLVTTLPMKIVSR